MRINWQLVTTAAFLVFALCYFWLAPKAVIRLRDRLEPTDDGSDSE